LRAFDALSDGVCEELLSYRCNVCVQESGSDGPDDEDEEDDEDENDRKDTVYGVTTIINLTHNQVSHVSVKKDLV